MQGLAESMSHLADQLHKLKDVPSSKEMYHTINEFPVMMEEGVDFIHNWLESWLGAYPSAWDGISTEPSVQPSTSLLFPRRTELLSCRRRWMDSGIGLLPISQQKSE